MHLNVFKHIRCNRLFRGWFPVSIPTATGKYQGHFYQRISGLTGGACYLSSYCMSYFINTLLLLNHFYDPFYFKGRIKSTISPLNLTPVFIITFYLATEHKKVNQTDCHGQTIQKWACCYTSELCIGLSYVGGKEMKRSLNLPEKGVKRTRA